MKISDYYRQTADSSLNLSLLALVPAILLIMWSAFILKSNTVMVLTTPFLLLSFISFQSHHIRLQKAIRASQNGKRELISRRKLLRAGDLLPVYDNKFNPGLILFDTDGNQAGQIKKTYRFSMNGLRISFETIYILEDEHFHLCGMYKLKKGKKLRIDAFDYEGNFIGSFSKKGNMKELVKSTGGASALIKGSRMFMDEQVCGRGGLVLARLRRGWMPVEWDKVFQEPNAPVFTVSERMSERERVLLMAVLINEFFTER